jgi:hypothetical protein
MKRLIVPLLGIILLLGCNKEKNEVCNLDSPLTELSWLKAMKANLDINCITCEMSIFQAEYNSNIVFYESLTDPVCDGVFRIELFNCSGELVKTYDFSSADEFTQEVTNVKKLYSCTPRE